MSLRNIIAISFAVVAFAACGSSEKLPPTAGEAKSFETVCDKANDGKRVSVEGYLRLPEESINPKGGGVLRLYSTAEAGGKPVGVSTEFGNEPNKVRMVPMKYTDKDLKVNMANGQVAGMDTKVRVSGDVYYPLIGQTFQCALSNPLIESAQ